MNFRDKAGATLALLGLGTGCTPLAGELFSSREVADTEAASPDSHNESGQTSIDDDAEAGDSEGPEVNDVDRPQLPRIFAANSSVCVLRTDRRVQCWGWESALPDPDAPMLTQNVIAFGNGWNSGCAVLESDGSLDCWGQLPGLVLANTIPEGSFAHVACGSEWCCARDSQGRATCWGTNLLPDIPAGPFRDFTASTGSSCAIWEDDGSIECWGDLQISPPSGEFTQLWHAVGSTSYCARAVAGPISCWGFLGEAQQGIEEVPDDAQTVAMSPSSLCFLDSQGHPRCSGSSDTGNLAALPGPFVDIALGDDYGCGVTADDKVECWGELDNPP